MALSKQDPNMMVKTLKEHMQDMPKNMRFFSLAMRSLYSDQAVGGTKSASVKFRKLRDNTRDDAMVYLKIVLPVSEKFVDSIKAFFTIYKNLKYDRWCKSLPYIQKKTSDYKELAETILKMHKDMLLPLKKREDEAKVIIREFKDLQIVFNKESESLRTKAKTKSNWALGLAFVPLIGAIALPILSSAQTDIAESVAKLQESDNHERAAFTVAHTLIPALNAFITGLESAAGFFKVMENELRAFEGLSKEAMKSADSDEKEFHYEVMKGASEDMCALCNDFIAVLPAVRTDFEAIPMEGTDKSYVDRWLEKQKEAIKSKDLFESIKRAITEK